MKRTSNRQGARQRRLFHEQLEDRRLLNADMGWLFGVGGDGATVVGGDMAVDSAGNVLVTGSFHGGTIDFDPGPSVAELSASDDSVAFVAKYAPDGSFLWTSDMSGTGTVYAYGCALDAEGNAYVVGSFWETATFGDTAFTSQGESDAFVAKLGGDGSFIWTVQAGSAGAAKAGGVDADATGHVYVAGDFKDTITLGSYEIASSGEQDALVAKLDGNGQVVWARGMGGVDLVRARRVLSVSDGAIYLSGWFQGTANFGGHQLVSAGEVDSYIAKLDSSEGSVLWAQQVGGSSVDFLNDMSVDANGNVVATGSFTGVADFGLFELTSSEIDGFVFKMNGSGTVLWARSLESAAGAAGHDVTLDGDGNVYVIGKFNESADFAPGPGVALLVSANGDGEAFLWKLDAGGNYITAKRIGGPGSDSGVEVAVDGKGDVYLVGGFNDWGALRPVTAEFPNGTLTLNGSTDMYVAKLPAHTLETHNVLFSDSFENGQWGGKWVEDSQSDWFTSTQRATLGSNSAEVDGRATNATLTTATPIDLTPYGSVELMFDWYIENTLDASEYLAVDLFDGSTWSEVARLDGNVDAEDVWHQPYVQIPSDHLVENFQFRFRAKMSGSDEDANVDNVQLVATSLAGPANTAPDAVDDSATTPEDVAVSIDVLANDTDPDGDPALLTIESVTQGAHGAVSINGTEVVYTPDTNFHGNDNFTYTISDGRGGTDVALVAVTVTPEVDAPDAVDDYFTATADEVLSIAAPGVLDKDSHPDGVAYWAVAVTNGATIEGGQVTLNIDGSFTYTPPTGFTGIDTFSYTITDGNLTDQATVSIELSAVTTDTPFYVYDIRFESKLGGRFWQAVIEIRSDSNTSGGGDSGDLPVAGAAITVTFAGNTYTGTTGSDGVFRTAWIKNLGSGSYTADVTDLAMADYYWDPLMDLEDDDTLTL